ncbi:uncharacterized protein LOC125038214 isoform X2 [Penaeus chinensis]|uniref:uncharacterized protein LOC125038214 isoform X2 n=1 Tax=Penaeus chinensis TaxID=139456 RepID=UPI001FB81DF1|nr:uncharacterized protein LOC125038214 isoform X2 [Penaeus chinensis]
MDKFRHIWKGQLVVGLRDIGQATIWTNNNSYLPPIGWNLKMTYIAEYSDLWSKVLESEPTVLSQDSCTKIKDKYVSVFTLTSSTPEFLQLTKELNQFSKARIILSVIPKDTEITLMPCCKETMRLGMWEPPEEYHPFLYMLMISKTSPKKAMKQHKKHYLQVMSQMNLSSAPHSLLKEKKTDHEHPKKDNRGHRDEKSSPKSRKADHSRGTTELLDTAYESKMDEKLERERRKEEVCDPYSANARDKWNYEHRRKESRMRDKERDKDRAKDKKEDRCKKTAHYDEHRKERKVEKGNNEDKKSKQKKREEENGHGSKASQQKMEKGEKYNWQEKDRKSRTSSEKAKSDNSPKDHQEEVSIKHTASKSDVMEKIKKKEEEKVRTVESLLKSAIKTKDLNPINIEIKDKVDESGKSHVKYPQKSGKACDKKSLLDTKKLNLIFSSKDKKRPDLVKPSMLKRSAKGELDQALKTITPDLIASSELTYKLSKTYMKESKISDSKKINSVKSVLKGTLKKFTSTSDDPKKGSKEKGKGKSEEEKGIFQGAEELSTPRSKHSEENYPYCSDNSIRIKEFHMIQERTSAASEKNSFASSMPFHWPITSASPHKNEDQENTQQNEENVAEDHRNKEIEKDGKSNVKDALDNFREFINTKFGKKRKSECTEKSLQMLQSPSKKPRIIDLSGCPAENILNTPQTSCYPDIFRNIKHKYKKSVHSSQFPKVVTTDKLGKDTPQEIVAYSNILREAGQDNFPVRSLQGIDDEVQVITTEPDDLFLHGDEPLDLSYHEPDPLNLSIPELLNLSIHGSKSVRKIEADVIEGDDNSLAETESWKGEAAPETTNHKTPCSEKGKRYILEMFLHSVQDRTDSRHQVSDVSSVATQESSPILNMACNESVQNQKVFSDQNVLQNSTGLTDKDLPYKDGTFVYHEDYFYPEAPNDWPLHIQYPVLSDQSQSSDKLANDYHFSSCNQDPMPSQTGIPIQDFSPGHRHLDQPVDQSSSDQLHIDNQQFTPYLNKDHAVDLRLMLSRKQPVSVEYFTTDQMIDSGKLLDSNEYPIAKQFPSPEHNFANAAAHSSPRMVLVDVIKEELQNNAPIIHPLPDLPPLTRLSDLVPPVIRKQKPIQDLLVAGTGAESKPCSSSNWLAAVPSNSRSSLIGESPSSHGKDVSCIGLKSSEIIDIFNQKDNSKPESYQASASQEESLASCNLETIELDNSDTSLKNLSTSVVHDSIALKIRSSFERLPDAQMKEEYLLKTSFASSNLNNSTVSHDVYSQSNSSQTSIFETCNTFVNARSTYTEPLVLQQLKRKINLWQDSLISKSSISLTKGFTALADFIKKPTTIPPDIRKETVFSEDELGKSSLHMKKALLSNLLNPSERILQLDEQVSKKVVAVECKEECCDNTKACLPKPLSQDNKYPFPESVKHLREETQGQRKLIENKKVVLNLLEPSELIWDDAVSGISKSTFQSSKYIHLFGASENDVLKAKHFCRAHQMTYATLDDLVRNGGYMLVQHSSVDKLLSSPHLTVWCTQPNIKFGVYTSLSSLLKNDVSPVMTSKWLLLLHHTAMVDPLLVTVLEQELKDWNSSTSHHPRIVIPILTLKICYCSARADAVERSVCRILQKNLVLLTKCLGSGVALLTDENCSWGGVGPESSIHMHLQCLRVIHYNFRLAHRQALLVVGESVPALSIVDPFYKVQTVGKFVETE